MTDHRFHGCPLAILLGCLILSACGTSDDSGPSGNEATTLEASFFQQQWEGGGSTLLIEAVDGEFVWRNRAEMGPGDHEILFEYQAIMTCSLDTGCIVRRYHDRISLDAQAGHAYTLRAEREEGVLHSWIEEAKSGDIIASRLTKEASLEHVGYPDVAWQGLCDDAERGDGKARRAIGLHYWRGWWPTERDLVRAYQWLSLAAWANDGDAPGLRDKLADEMTGDQIVEAERLVARWKPGQCELNAGATTWSD